MNWEVKQMDKMRAIGRPWGGSRLEGIDWGVVLPQVSGSA